jgi:hypothetical protein
LGWPFITFFRDPVERIISHYSVWRTAKTDEKRERDIFWFNKYSTNVAHYLTKGRLDLFKFVGITERFEESLDIIEKIFDFEFKNKRVVRNVTPKKRKLKFDGRTRRKLDRINDRDRDLYEAALRNWDKMAQEYL